MQSEIQSDTEQAASGLRSPMRVSVETLEAACQRITALEDLARNVAALSDKELLSADLNFYRNTIREYRKQARELMS